MGHISLLENGGTVVVVGGFNKAWQSFRNNPRIVFWTGEQKEIARYVRERSFPSNCKAVIISRFLSHSELGVVLPEARKRRLVLFPNKSDGEITELLDDLVRDSKERELLAPQPLPLPIENTSVNTSKPIEVTTVAKRQMAKKGELNKVIQFVDWSRTNIDNARALMATAIKELGISTTEDSLAQFIRVQRKKKGLPNATNIGSKKNGAEKKPRKATEKEIKGNWGTEDVFVKKIDEIIESLQDVRTLYIETAAQNKALQAEQTKIAPLIAAIKALK
jgi:hypothetical protein